MKGSRFFEWMAKWCNLRPFWGFLRIVYETWHVLKGKDIEAGASDTAAGDADGQGDDQPDQQLAPEETRRTRESQKQVHADLMQELRDKQKSRHTLSVVRDILRDDRVKIYASMQLD